MINKFIWLLIVIILLLAVRPALTQPVSVNGYAVQHFTDENGLPQNSINDLLFDENGYLWLATQVGLVRYDGGTFQLYYPGDKPAMESNIRWLGKDHKGAVYFQTIDHRLYSAGGNDDRHPSPLNPPSSRPSLLLNTQKKLFDFSDFLTREPSPAETRERRAIFNDLLVHNGNFFVTDTAGIYLYYHDSLYYYNNKGGLCRLCRLTTTGCRFLVQGNRLFVLHAGRVLQVFDGTQSITQGLPIESDPHQPFPAGIAADRFQVFSCGRVDHLLAGSLLYRLFPGPGGRIRAVFLLDLSFIPHISAVEYNPGLDLLLVATHTEGFYLLRRNRFDISW